jgi:hypothetical protein
MPLDQVQTWGDLLWETLRALNTLTTLGGARADGRAHGRRLRAREGAPHDAEA